MTETVVKSIKIPVSLEKKIQTDADNEMRSFSAQANKILTKHYEGKKK